MNLDWLLRLVDLSGIGFSIGTNLSGQRQGTL